jgi:hypothetical protein
VFLFHLLSPFLVSNVSSGWRAERWIAKRYPAEEAKKKKKQNEAPGTELANITSQTSNRHETAVRATPGRKKETKLRVKQKQGSPAEHAIVRFVVIERMSSRRREKKSEWYKTPILKLTGDTETKLLTKHINTTTTTTTTTTRAKKKEESRGQRRRIYKMFKNHDFCYSLEVAEEESEASL